MSKDDITTETVNMTTADPYTARQCTVCDKWIAISFTAEGEGHEDYDHFEKEHPEVLKAEGPNAIGFPFCSWNDKPVTL